MIKENEKRWLELVKIVHDLEKKLNALVKNQTGVMAIMGHIRYDYTLPAENGYIMQMQTMLEKLDKYLEPLHCPFYNTKEYNSYKEAVVACNYEKRKNEFLHYATTNDEEINSIKQSEIKKYKELLEKVEKLVQDGKVSSKNDTSSFLEIVKNEIKGEIPFDVIYNGTNKLWSDILYSNDQLSKNLHNDMMTNLQKRIEQLQNMTLKEFRTDKVKQLNLSQEELEFIKREAKKQ